MAWGCLNCGMMMKFLPIRFSVFQILAGLMLMAGITIMAAEATVGFAQSQKPVDEQTASKADPKSLTSIDDKLGQWRGILQTAEQAIDREGVNDSDLERHVSDAQKVQLDALAAQQELEPLVAQIKNRLDELGPAPKEGEPAESEEIAKSRADLEAVYSILDGQLKASRLIGIRADQIQQKVASERRTRFVREITRFSQSPFEPAFWASFIDGFVGYFHRLEILVNDSVGSIRAKLSEQDRSRGLLWFGLVGVIVAGVGLSRLISKRALVIPEPGLLDQTVNDERNRVRYAVRKIVASGIIPAITIILIQWLLHYSEILPKRLDIILSEFLTLVALWWVAGSIAHYYMQPFAPQWRLVTLSDDAAHYSWRVMNLGLFLTLVARILGTLSVVLISPQSVPVGFSMIAALTVLLTTVTILIAVAKDQLEQEANAVSINKRFFRWGYLAPLLWIGVLAGFIALFTGYISLSVFISDQLMLLVMAFACAWLVLSLLDVYHELLLNEEQGNWRRISGTTGFTRESLVQSGVFGFGLAKLAVIASIVAVFLLSWGLRTGEWAGKFKDAFFGFKVGNLTISLSSLVLALVIFFAGYLITKAIQQWLRLQFLPTTRMDVGMRNSISIVFGYAGTVLALLLAISAAGVDLSKIAIIAGALSVGIGFGLQSIVNNFVSGLILLAERPIKSGDWIVTSGGQGTVRRTSVRSTEIETFDGATIIVPNSTLISDPVTNWTHHDQHGRIIIAVGVGYDSDTQQVKKLLLECAEENGKLLADPAPNVFLVDFGADALIFELRGYLADINRGFSTKSELRFAIIEKLRGAGVEIPFPQRDIHIRSGLEMISNKAE